MKPASVHEYSSGPAPPASARRGAHRQATDTAPGYRVEGAKKVATLNIGGSGTTSVSFVVGVE